MKQLLLVRKMWWLAMAQVVLLVSLAHAQDARLPLEQLDKLAKVADQTVEVALDERLLQVAAKFLSKSDPKQALARELVNGLKGIYVRVYKFDAAGEYAITDVEPLRNLIKGNGWARIVGVRSRRDGQNVDVHLRMLNDEITALAIIAAQPKELVVVNILGPIDLEKLSQLEGQFGIPQLDLERTSKPKPKNE